MPNVDNVSEIVNILSGTIQRNVLVRGTVEILANGPPNAFFLTHAGNRLRCFIPGGNIFQFGALLTPGNTVIVDGRITLFSSFSQYQITVSNIPVNGGNANTSSVTEITDEISGLVGRLALQNIQIQGKVLAVFLGPVSNWDICDVDGPPELQIKCVHRGPTPINPALQIGDNVCVRGNVSIFPSQSLYQLNVTDVGPIDNFPAQCQCSGCPQCGNAPQCGRLREVANFESCTTCLPRPPDELYKLCPECYAISPDHETEVADAVYAYFEELEVNGFSPDREHCIQFGARNGKADVVLVDQNGSFAVVAECKGAGYTGHGIEQLKSYLSATDTRFGVFANKVDCNQWKFYENRGGNCIPEIDCSEFKAGVVEGVVNRGRLRDEIANLNGEIAGLENQKSELHTAIREASQTKHNLTERTSNLTQQIETLQNYKSELHKEIHRKLDNLLEEKMQRLERPLSDLKIELQKRGIINWLKNLFSKENE